MQTFSLVRPNEPDAAIAMARSPGAKFIAGGTDLMQLMKDNIEQPTQLVDVDGFLPDTVTADANGLRIGALARMSDAAADPDLAQHYPAVAQALLASASPQLRNMATMGGNLLQRTRCGYFRDTGFPCNKRVPGSGCPAIRGENRNLAILGGSDHCIAAHPSDLAVALVALDASVELRGPNGVTRNLPVADLHRLPGSTPEIETMLEPGELITAIVVPASAQARRSYYLKLRDRASFEFALVSAAVAVDIDGGTIRTARVALGGVGTKPWRALAAEAALQGRGVSEDTFGEAASRAAADANPASQNGFKVKLAQRAVLRALQTVAA